MYLHPDPHLPQFTPTSLPRHDFGSCHAGIQMRERERISLLETRMVSQELHGIPLEFFYYCDIIIKGFTFHVTECFFYRTFSP